MRVTLQLDGSQRKEPKMFLFLTVGSCETRLPFQGRQMCRAVWTCAWRSYDLQFSCSKPPQLHILTLI